MGGSCGRFQVGGLAGELNVTSVELEHCVGRIEFKDQNGR